MTPGKNGVKHPFAKRKRFYVYINGSVNMKHKKDWPAMYESFGSTLKSSWAKTILS